MADASVHEASTEELRQRNRELSILNAIAEALNREVNLTQALRTTLTQVAELLGLDTGWVWLLSDDADDPYLAAAQNLPSGLVKNPHLMEGSCYCLRTYREGDLKGAANVNVVTCSRLQELVDGTDGLRYHASIPLYAPNNKRLGVLNVASTDWRELSGDDLRLLHTVGDLLSIAVERARLFEDSAKLGALEERNRLAREIHDTIAQGLAAVALQLESAEALMDTGTDPAQVRRSVRQALVLTQSNLEEARRSVLDLWATPLEGRTLAEALEALAEDSASEALEIGFKTTGRSRPLPPRVEAGVYRIAQEALTNTVRHAEATRVRVRLNVTSHHVQLTVEDDGKGFDPSKVPEGRHGLTGLNERAGLLGGKLSVESGRGAGTRLGVRVPVPPSRIKP